MPIHHLVLPRANLVLALALIDPFDTVIQELLRPQITTPRVSLEQLRSRRTSTQPAQFAGSLLVPHFLVRGCADELAYP